MGCFSGIGAMEIVAMDMKLRGSYIARQLSFHGTTFRIEDTKLSPDYMKMYDKSVALVRLKIAYDFHHHFLEILY